MKALKKIQNMKVKCKILLFVIVTLCIAGMNFICYNYRVFKLPQNDRNYTIDFNDIKYKGFELKNNTLIQTSDKATIKLNLKQKYLRDIIIDYDASDEIHVQYTGQESNAYGFMEDYEDEDVCYDFLNHCGLHLNNKVSTLQMKFEGKDIEIHQIKVEAPIYFNWSTFIFFFIGIHLLLFLFFEGARFKEKKHILFLICALSIGAIFLCSTHNVTSISFDDEMHYRNSLGLLRGTKQSTTDNHLSSYLAFKTFDTSIERQDYQDYLNQHDKELLYTNNNSDIFSPTKLVYLPYALAMKVASLIGCDKMTCFFFARVVSLILYCFVFALAIKIIPNYKNLLMVIGLLPQSLYLASNFSYDPTVIAFTTLAFAIFYYEYHHKNEKLQLKNVLLFVFASLYGSFPKVIYVTILLLMLFLPKEKFETRKQKWKFNCLIILLFCCAFVTFVGPMLTKGNEIGDTRGGAVLPIAQMKLVFAAPLSSLSVIYHGIFLNSLQKFIIPDTYGILGYYGKMGQDISYIFVLLAIVLCSLERGEYKKIEFKQKVISFLLIAFTICEIYLSMFVLFTPFGKDHIAGIQARYFIPLLFPFLYHLAYSNLNNGLSKTKTTFLSVVLMCSANLYLIYYTILQVYFI